MTVQSGWVGSSAVTETNKRYMSEARVVLGLSAIGWMSEMIGKGAEITVTISASNHNFNTSTLHSMMLSAAGGTWPSTANWRIIVNSGVQLVCHSSNDNCFWLGGNINGKVVIDNNGYILGRGGDGGKQWQAGLSGGTAIYRESKITLEIINNGVIAGGGGGGGSAHREISGGREYGGGGGAPFGAGGSAPFASGSAASFDVPGNGANGPSYAGNGGSWGVKGGDAPQAGSDCHPGGAAGYAFAGGGTIIWTKRGDVRGNIS